MKLKRFLLLSVILLVFFVSLACAEKVEIKGLVNDYANVLTPEYKVQIEEVLKKLYDSKTAEFSVVTVNSLDGQDIESYSINLAQGVLGDKEKNNGLLLLVAVKDRQYRFEVGRGIEPVLNDAKVGRIGRTYLVENFRNNDYGKGIYEAVIAVNGILLGENQSGVSLDECACEEGKIPFKTTVLGRTECSCKTLSEALPYILIFMILPIVIFGLIIFFVARNMKKHKGDDKYFNAALMAGLLFGGKGRGGFGGGGFGGFGGGSMGGGGASGGW